MRNGVSASLPTLSALQQPGALKHTMNADSFPPTRDQYHSSPWALRQEGAVVAILWAFSQGQIPKPLICPGVFITNVGSFSAGMPLWALSVTLTLMHCRAGPEVEITVSSGIRKKGKNMVMIFEKWKHSVTRPERFASEGARNRSGASQVLATGVLQRFNNPSVFTASFNSQVLASLLLLCSQSSSYRFFFYKSIKCFTWTSSRGEGPTRLHNAGFGEHLVEQDLQEALHLY